LLATLTQPGGRSSIWTVSVVEDNPRLVREDARGWAVSPDGSQIAFTIGRSYSDIYNPVDVVSYNHEIWVMSSRGENAQKVVAAAEDESLGNIQWAPHGEAIAYMSTRKMRDGVQMSIRVNTLKDGRPVVVISGALADFSWLPGGRLIYALFDSPTGSFAADGNLWEVSVDARTAEPFGKPVQLTRWAGFRVENLSSSTDGRRLAFVRRSWQAHAYVGQLSKDGTAMQPPRRLTFLEAQEWPLAWTADSKAVIINSDRNGQFEVFKQYLDQETAQLIATDSQRLYLPRLSPDGSWILYCVLPKSMGSSTPIRLMRVPMGGGLSDLVLVAHNFGDFHCAAAPATLCALNEKSADHRSLTVTAFDPVKGRGRVLMTIPTDPSDFDDDAVLSPDGTRFAYLRFGQPHGHIQLLSLEGRLEREITVKQWPGFTSLDWLPDGKAMYCGTYSAGRATLLQVDLDGNARVVWQHEGTHGASGIWGIPSPDGRYLAIMTEAMDSNLWMLENF
jgi:Tol biopolymer transport system component